MRLIDADAIQYCNYDLDNYHSFRAVDEDEIAEMPTIDVVPVVRCKDCKHWDCLRASGEGQGYCRLESNGNWQIWTWHHNDFCSYGERK